MKHTEIYDGPDRCFPQAKTLRCMINPVLWCSTFLIPLWYAFMQRPLTSWWLRTKLSKRIKTLYNDRHCFFFFFFKRGKHAWIQLSASLDLIWKICPNTVNLYAGCTGQSYQKGWPKQRSTNNGTNQNPKKCMIDRVMTSQYYLLRSVMCCPHTTPSFARSVKGKFWSHS